MKLKFSARERWVLAALPAVLIFGGYFYGYVDRLTANVEDEQKRVDAAAVPLPPAPPPASLGQAKKSLEDAKHNLADRDAHIRELETRLAAQGRINLTSEDLDAVRVIQRVEAAFTRNGVTPLISEAASESQSVNQAPAPLLAVLSAKGDSGAASAPKEQALPRVWHCIFDNSTPNFHRALLDLSTVAPSVVPLSMNLVYNPENSGESRLLEVWFLY